MDLNINQDRTGLLLSVPLNDNIADSPDELDEGGVIFGKGFGVADSCG